MEQARLSVQIREGKGKGSAHAIRRSGAVPAIIYGHKLTPIPVQFPEKSLRRLMATGGENVIINMDLGNDNSETVIVKEVQIDPVSRRILHADFIRVSMEERITTRVHVEITGTAPGISEGGVLEFLHREIEVECQAGQIPERVVVDVSSLSIGDQIRVETVKLDEDVKILDDPSTTIVTIAAPTVEKEAVAEAVLEQAEEVEPEVIGGKRKEEEEEE